MTASLGDPLDTVLVTSSHRRVAGGLRALLEAAGNWRVQEVAPEEVTATARSKDVIAVVVDLTGPDEMPGSLVSLDGPPIIGLCRQPHAVKSNCGLAAVVSIDEGVDAIVAAVRASHRGGAGTAGRS